MADLRLKRTAEAIQLIIPVSEIRKLVLKTTARRGSGQRGRRQERGSEMTATTRPASGSAPAAPDADVVRAFAGRGRRPPAGRSGHGPHARPRRRSGSRKYGPNALAEAKAEPVWKRFLKQYKEYMQIVLVVAAS